MRIKRIKALLLTTALVVAVSGVAVAQNDNDRDDNRGNHEQDSNRQWGQNRNADAREYGFHNGYRAGFERGRNRHNTSDNNSGYNNGNSSDNDRDDNNGGYNNGNNSNDGYNNNNGYDNDGDRRNHMNDTDGYQSSMGSRGQYKNGYREGFSAGYNDASNNRRAQYPYVYGQSGQRTPWDPDGDGQPGTSSNSNFNGTAARFGMEDGLSLGRRDRESGHSSRPTAWKAYQDADHGMSSASGYSSGQYKQEYRRAFMDGYSQGYGYNR